MFPFPSRNLTLVSPLSVEEAVAALKATVGRRETIGLRQQFAGYRGPKRFLGTVTAEHFELIRNVNYRADAWLPLVRGSFAARPSGCTVAITLRMQVEFVFLLIILTALLIPAAVGLWRVGHPYGSGRVCLHACWHACSASGGGGARGGIPDEYAPRP